MRYTVNKAVNKVKSNMPDSPLKDQQKHTAQRGGAAAAERLKILLGCKELLALPLANFLRRDHHNSGYPLVMSK